MSAGGGLDEALVDPSTVGYKFVEQYYDVLNRDPPLLHRFYAPEASVLSYGTEGESNESAKGQQKINRLILENMLSSAGCKSVIMQADCQYGPGNSILIQVIGFLGSGDDEPMRKFVQTFCLQKEGGTDGRIRYSIHNDIFRYLKEDAAEEVVAGSDAAADSEPMPVVPNGVASADHHASMADANELLKEVEVSSLAFQGMISNLGEPVSVKPTPPSVNNNETTTTTKVDHVPVVAPPPAAVEPVAPAPPVVVVVPVAAPAPAPVQQQPAQAQAPAPVAEEPKPKGPFSYASAIATAAARPAPQPAKPAPRAVSKPAPVAAPVATASATSAAASTSTTNGVDDDGGRSRTDKGRNPSLYVRNLPPECTEVDLERVFAEYSPMRKGAEPGIAIYPNKVPPKNANQPHGRYAFVELEESSRCIADSEGGKVFNVHGKQIFVVERMNDRGGGGGSGRGGRGRGDGRSRRGRGGDGRGRGREARVEEAQ